MSDTLLRNANSLLGHGRQREALAYYERYLDSNPNSAEAWHNRGAAFAQLKHCNDALACYDRALGLRPDSAQSWNARGNVLIEERRYSEAVADYGKTLAIDPEFPYASGYRLLAKLWCCDWRDLDTEWAAVATGIAQGKRVIPPFGSLMVSRDPEALARAARVWMMGRHGAPAPLWRGETYCHDKIRVAYLSGDFRDHPVAHLMVGVLEHHDSTRFETMAVSFGPDDSGEVRARIAGAAGQFIDARMRTDLDIAILLRQNEIDVAVDLMGLTADCRTGILAHRPVPAQVNYLGFPGTMATPYMDYILADSVTVPQSEQRYFSEKIVYLPDSYMANDDKRRIADALPRRAALGLPGDGFVFCSFNNAYKFTPDIFSIWMRLLNAIEGSVLWLPESNATARANLMREAQIRGIAPARIVFAPFLDSQADHLARLACADLFLDTLPCNAHSTASDALWAGLPVLTCAGSTFPGRVAASLLHAIGLPELVAASPAEYEATALRLAQDGPAIARIRAKLAQNWGTMPLFDTARFTRHLEAAYAGMVARYARGEPPASFAVERVA